MENLSGNTRMIREPLLSNPKGGLRLLPFILANEALERMASFGLTPNMILYMTREYHLETVTAAQIISLWSSASFLTPVIGALLADSYVGRYPMIAFGSVASLLGMVLLWLTTAIPQARPRPCPQVSGTCESASTLQLLLLYSSFIVLSIGGGGIRSSSMAFGVDQLPERDINRKGGGILETFFSWYYAAVTVSILLALTFIVYIQDAMGWKVGFGVPVVLMFLSTLLFFLASPFYAMSEVKGSLLTRLAQVIVAAYKNKSIELSSQDTDPIYHQEKGSVLARPTETLRFLNKACVIINPQEDLTVDGRASDPWRLCTVEQVEDLKALIKVLPIWLSGTIMSISVTQGSLLVIQATTMDRHITSKFEIPAGSFHAFLLFSLVLCVVLYDRVIVPLASKIKGKPTRLSLKQGMGIGILFSFASVVALAIVESVRRKIAVKEGFSDDPSAVVPMSAMWLLPYLVLAGFAEAFNAIGQNEFFYTELPKNMSSVATSLGGLGVSAANLIASFMMRTVDDFTGRRSESWVSSNINKGHYDYYYWLLASLGVTNFLYYLACSKAYGPSRASGRVDDHY